MALIRSVSEDRKLEISLETEPTKPKDKKAIIKV